MENNNSENNSALLNKVKTGLGSFLTMVVLTYINIFLFLINSSVSFPFSAFIPSLCAAVANATRQNGESMILVLIIASLSVIFTSIFLLLYFLSRKYLLPVWIALVIFILDTAAMLYLASDIGAILIDIIFHIWVIYSLVGLIKARIELNKLEQLPAKKTKTATKKKSQK